MEKFQIRLEAVLFNKDGELLLALHKKSRDSYWVLPGGHLKFGEKMETGLQREIREEIGINNPDIREFLFIDEFIDPETNRHVIKAGFLVEIKEEEINNLSVKVKGESIKDIRFFSSYDIDSSLDTFYPSKEFFLKVLQVNNG
jgi:8-oxo-dGTP diphosphatase